MKDEVFINLLGYKEPNLVHLLRCKVSSCWSKTQLNWLLNVHIKDVLVICKVSQSIFVRHQLLYFRLNFQTGLKLWLIKGKEYHPNRTKKTQSIFIYLKEMSSWHYTRPQVEKSPCPPCPCSPCPCPCPSRSGWVKTWVFERVVLVG